MGRIPGRYTIYGYDEENDNETLIPSDDLLSTVYTDNAFLFNYVDTFK